MSRTSLAVIAAASAALIAGCGSSAESAPATQTSSPPISIAPTTTTTPPPTTTATENPTPDGVPATAQKAIVKDIVDGDTLDVAAVSAGSALETTQRVDVRLLEIDTPETVHPSSPVQCYGKKATNALAELAPVGSTVWIQRDEELKDQYDRFLLYLWNDEGTFVNLELVEQGYARAVLYEPNDLYWDKISSAEASAKSSGEGVWSACPYFGAPKDTPEPTPEPQPEPEPVPDEDDGGNAYLFPPPPPDKDCGSISANNFQVRPGDPHRFDSDGDGIGCES